MEAVQDSYDVGDERRRSDDSAETVARDAVGFGEGEEVDEGRAPRGRGKEMVGWSRGDEVAVGLVDYEGDIVLLRKLGEGGDEGRSVDCACLGRSQI